MKEIRQLTHPDLYTREVTAAALSTHATMDDNDEDLEKLVRIAAEARVNNLKNEWKDRRRGGLVVLVADGGAEAAVEGEAVDITTTITIMSLTTTLRTITRRDRTSSARTSLKANRTIRSSRPIEVILLWSIYFLTLVSATKDNYYHFKD